MAEPVSCRAEGGAQPLPHRQPREGPSRTPAPAPPTQCCFLCTVPGKARSLRVPSGHRSGTAGLCWHWGERLRLPSARQGPRPDPGDTLCSTGHAVPKVKCSFLPAATRPSYPAKAAPFGLSKPPLGAVLAGQRSKQPQPGAESEKSPFAGAAWCGVAGTEEALKFDFQRPNQGPVCDKSEPTSPQAGSPRHRGAAPGLCPDQALPAARALPWPLLWFDIVWAGTFGNHRGVSQGAASAACRLGRGNQEPPQGCSTRLGPGSSRRGGKGAGGLPRVPGGSGAPTPSPGAKQGPVRAPAARWGRAPHRCLRPIRLRPLASRPGFQRRQHGRG